MKKNYQKQLDGILENIAQHANQPPTLLLHACCAPCSSYVLEYLTEYFKITVLYYNPNIDPQEEYIRRRDELKKMIRAMGMEERIALLEGRYDSEAFFARSRGLEQEPEGGTRCRLCFVQRLEEAARQAAELGADYFTTTLTISPHKDAELINVLGMEIGAQYGVAYLCSDFKKREGFKRSIELSREYGLYRQDYCGCRFSKRIAGGKEPPR